MKYLFTLFFLIGGLTIYAQNAIDGNWKGVRERPNGNIDFIYTFKVEGTELKGTQKSQFGEIALEKGKVDGKKFSFNITFQGVERTSTGELISDDEILIKGERGVEMKLTRVKQ